ncbi:hypothetical protein RT41_GL001316 [Lactococcus fujiensis JCM 16395]|uniref:DNA binding protein n=1 Tax=Lactococcus fujiensis JCM 16395 TaxID=1291764 RepID=A0A2A5RMB3_9LACT|nr:hypothetical protein RT41_GL001316 [Lactococcus fujiensis JCM 16395]
MMMYGTDEPWWFFEGWKEDIISVKEFDNFSRALKFYKNEWLDMAKKFEKYKSQDDLLSAFWEPQDQIWCEECAGYQQQYHGLALLEDWHQLPTEKKRWAYSKQSGENPAKFCSTKLGHFDTLSSDLY